MKTLVTIIDKVNSLLKTLLFILFGIMLVVLSMQVAARFFQGALSWSEELSRYVMIWMTYIGAAVAMRESKLISLTVMVRLLRLSASKIRVVNGVATAISCAFCGLVVYLSYEFLGVVAKQSSPAIGLSMAIPYAAIPTGCLMMFVNALVGFFDSGKNASESGEAAS